MAVKGIFVSDAGGLQERSDALSSTILKEERGGSVPLYALSSGMANSPATNTIISWYEEGLMVTFAEITAINAPTGNQITVDDSSWITENMVMMVDSTGEYIFVMGVVGNTLTVQRGISNTSVANIVVGSETIRLQLIGTAFEEASERPTSVSTNPYPRTNVTQIFRNAWDISGTAQAVSYKFGDRMAKNKGDAAMFHAEDIERTLIWGKRHDAIVMNKPQRHMDGVLAQLRSNIFVGPASGLSRRVLEDFCERLFSKNIKGKPNERITFCGNTALRALNEIAYRYGDYSIAVRENEFGIDVRKFISPFGTLTLIPHPLMNAAPVWAHDIYSLHPAAMEISWLRRTQHESEGTNGSASDLRDAKSGVFTSELTVKYGLEATGAIMTDVKPNYYELENCSPCGGEIYGT